MEWSSLVLVIAGVVIQWSQIVIAKRDWRRGKILDYSYWFIAAGSLVTAGGALNVLFDWQAPTSSIFVPVEVALGLIMVWAGGLSPRIPPRDNLAAREVLMVSIACLVVGITVTTHEAMTGGAAFRQPELPPSFYWAGGALTFWVGYVLTRSDEGRPFRPEAADLIGPRGRQTAGMTAGLTVYREPVS